MYCGSHPNEANDLLSACSFIEASLREAKGFGKTVTPRISVQDVKNIEVAKAAMESVGGVAEKVATPS